MTLAPAAVGSFSLSGVYRPELDASTQQGTLSLTDHRGEVHTWHIAGDTVTLQGNYSFFVMPEERSTYFTGPLTATQLTLRLDPTDFCAAQLKRHLDTFTLSLNRIGGKAQSLPWKIITKVQPDTAENAGIQQVIITPDQAKLLIDALANDGVLRGADTLAAATPEGYQILLQGDASPGSGFYQNWSAGMSLYRHLQVLQQALPADRRQLLEQYLQRNATAHARWKAEAALQMPLTLSLVDMPLSQAIAQFNTALAGNTPAISLSGTPTTDPKVRLYFRDIPARQCAEDLALTAGYVADYNDNKRVLSIGLPNR